MILRALLKRDVYYDSITLMSLVQAVKELPGVEDAGAVMATEMNRELLQKAGLLPALLSVAHEKPPGASDLLIAVRASDEEQAQAALQAAEKLLKARGASDGAGGEQGEPVVRSLEMVLRHDNRVNLAVISVPGEHAWLEAEQALRHNLHVFLFSDNVSLEQEKRLKKLALEKGLLLMGPDCGTALINGVGLGFSNVVPRGPIGIVGASGTGMQQLMCLVAEAGLGISQAIGTGGRDLSEEVGGMMTRRGLSLLADDPQTEVIVLLSKTPAERVAHEIVAAAQAAKPVVVVFPGIMLEHFSVDSGNVHLVRTLTEGAILAVALAGGDSTRVSGRALLKRDASRMAEERRRKAPSQRFIRALYSGGTLCDEAMMLLSEQLGPIASNIPLRPEWLLPEGEMAHGHSAIDLGADEFTRGRPHPMIDPTLRLQFFERAANDPETAVILLDIVLGFGAHQNPAAVYAPIIEQARAKARSVGSSLSVVVMLCGSEEDPQSLALQRVLLEDAGVLVYTSNVVAALAAIELVKHSGTVHIEEVSHG